MKKEHIRHICEMLPSYTTDGYCLPELMPEARCANIHVVQYPGYPCGSKWAIVDVHNKITVAANLISLHEATQLLNYIIETEILFT